MNSRNVWLRVALPALAIGCNQPVPPATRSAPDTAELPVTTQAAEPQPPISRDSLLGAWSADGENFVWVIDSTTILFEADMQQHPYRLSGDTLLIDRGDPAIGIQKTRILRLTGDTLVIQDVQAGASEALLRLR